MQIDRLLMKTVTRLARVGLPGARRMPEAEPIREPANPDAPRGSGSWANEWAGPRSTMDRAKSMIASAPKVAKPRRRKIDTTMVDAMISKKPMMTERRLSLHNWLCDRLEVEAPTCTVHVGVSVGTFLTSATAHEENDPLLGLWADMVIADETGAVVVALLDAEPKDMKLRVRVLDALIDGDVPIVDLPAKPQLAKLWSDIADYLPDA